MSNANDELVKNADHYCADCGAPTCPCPDWWAQHPPPRPTTGLDFGQALAAMREGKRVRRKKWLKHILCASIQADRIQLLIKHGKSQKWEKAYQYFWFESAILATDWEVVE